MTDDTTQPAEPPNGVPKTIIKGMQRQDEETLVDLIAYAKDLIDHLERPPDELADEGEEVVATEDVEDRENWTRVVKRVPCGKNCSGCPHGPYLYLVRRKNVDKLEWRYVGKAPSEGPGDELFADEEADVTDKENEGESDDKSELGEDSEGDAAMPLDDPEYPDQPNEDDEEDEGSEADG